MHQKPIYVSTKHVITLSPRLCDDFMAYTRHFVHSSQKSLEEYVDLLEQQGAPTSDEHVVAIQREIHRAQGILSDCEPLKGELSRIYAKNYVQLAEVLKQVRMQLGLECIEKMYSLKVVVTLTMDMLKAENDLFSQEKFLAYINEGGVA